VPRGGHCREDEDILLAATPAAWLTAAAARWRELLVDHANCEKKAASTALALMFAYPEDRELTLALSRLAREELRHFEQVLALMSALGVGFVRQQPGRYAQELRATLHTAEPARKLDLLLMGADRSALRGALSPARAVSAAAASAALHAPGTLRGASFCSIPGPGPRRRAAEWRARLATLAALEAQLTRSADRVLRFHSGPPQDGPRRRQADSSLQHPVARIRLPDVFRTGILNQHRQRHDDERAPAPVDRGR